MKAWITFVLPVYVLVTGVPSWGHQCSRQLGQKLESGAPVDERIQSESDLLRVLSRIGRVDSANANYDYLQSMVHELFQAVPVEQLQVLADGLIANYRFAAQEAIWSALLTHARGEGNASYTVNYLSRPKMDKSDFKRWTQMGGKFSTNKKFNEALALALHDYKSFEYVYGKQMDVGSSESLFMSGLEKLQDPALTGHFVEFFLSCDRLTRQYIIEKFLAGMKRMPDGKSIIITLGREDSSERNEVESRLAKLFRQSPEELQELAFFDYRSNGISNRPKLPDAETVKKVALRYIARKKYDIFDFGVSYAVEVILRDFKADAGINKVLQTLYDLGPREFQGRSLYQYAEFELSLVERNLEGHAKLKVDYRYAALFFSEKSPIVDRYIGDIARIHARFGIEKLPLLKILLKNFFESNPKALSDMLNSTFVDTAELPRLFYDIGITP